MKKNILMTLVAIQLSCLVAYTQTKYVDVTLHFQSKTFEPKNSLDQLMKLKEGDWYRIKIDSINLNLYEVAINFSDTTLSKELSTPGFAELGIESIGDLLGAIGSFSAVSPLTVAPESLVLKSAKWKSLDESDDWGDLIVTTSPDPIGQTLTQTAKTLDTYQKAIDKNKNDIEDFKIKLDKHYLNSLNEFVDYPLILDMDHELRKIEAIRNAIKKINTDLNQSNETYTQYADSKRKDIDAKSELKKSDALIVEAFSSLNKSINTLLESISSEKTLAYLKRLVLISNNNSRTYTSLPIQFNGEQGKVNIKISPISAESNLSSYSTEIRFPIKPKYYIGTGLAFYFSGLNDEVYSTQSFAVDTLTNYRLVREDDQVGEIGTSALLRIGKISSSNEKLGYHLSFGPAISLSEKAKPRLLLGAGLTYGIKHCIAIDGGLAVGHVQKLSNAFSVNDTFKEQPGSGTVAILSKSYFVSFGYSYRF